jgi:hypothetical protein
MIPSGARGGLKVFSTDGRLVATIARDLTSGTHALSWTGGNSLTKGLYLISLSCSNGIVLSRKVIRIR